MAKKQEPVSLSLLDELHTSGAGYDVLRYISLPELLGSESNTLLYYMGRNLARKLDIKAIEDISYIFEKLGWGEIELVKEKRKELFFYFIADSFFKALKLSNYWVFSFQIIFLIRYITIIKCT